MKGFQTIVASRANADWPFEIHCPLCGSSYQHHGRVRNYVRIDGEDSPTMRFVGNEVDQVPNEENPSWRRDAVVIEFDGECGHGWEMAILQHKGQTFIEIRIRDQGEG